MTDKDLHWQNDRIPASRRYGDIYFSTIDGLLESRHVFLGGINAPEIWQDKDHFTLLENGFGTGLNFAMTCHEWLKTAPPGARLTYIATEKHPLTKKDMDRTLSFWPELFKEKQNLLAKYPPATEGFHKRELFEGRIKLLLLCGDSAAMLPQLEAKVDAFYLDGFAPDRNPDMWSEKIFLEIARLAAPQARLATFSVAGGVQRGLAAVGFQIQKVPGFGRKRENLRGEYAGPASSTSKPWYQRPAPLAKGSRIAIIGGGIAGLTAGLALQNNGYRVTIYERAGQPMNQASGNPAGIIDPVINNGQGAEAVFYRAALLHAVNYFRTLDPDIFLTQGLTKFNGKDQVHFPDCGAISPPRIRDILRARLHIICGANIANIMACDNADAVILCGGPASHHFPETNQLPLDPVRGQITFLDADKYDDPPTRVLCGKGYLIPPLDLNGRTIMIAGASFGQGDQNTDIRAEDHRENLENAKILWPGIADRTVTGGRCAIRAYSPDHLPLCGPVPDFVKYQAAYEMLKHGPKHQDFVSAPYQKNLHIISGLGARGFMSAPLLGDIMSALICGEPLPVAKAVYESLHPARFLIRKLVKG
ncbi:MAG: hypothetical protein COB49_02745 [Alphaproteobacteria bacterium]|nr:MAG: hypothetical protein COB49_02745 [Alphaproteobacteria bacterium]